MNAEKAEVTISDNDKSFPTSWKLEKNSRRALDYIINELENEGTNDSYRGSCESGSLGGKHLGLRILNELCKEFGGELLVGLNNSKHPIITINTEKNPSFSGTIYKMSQ